MSANALTMDGLRAASDRGARRQRILTYGVFAVIAAYFVASFIQFDLGSIAKKWSPDRASLFMLDTYAHKDHVTMRWNKPDEIEVRFEGGHRHV